MKKYKKIYIEITNVCNLSCSFCIKVEKTPRFMSEEEFDHILSEIKPYTDTIYLHVKGEPLLHPKLEQFLKIAENYNINVNITTNGVLFPEKVSILSKAKSLRKINFSLHSENNISNYVERILENTKKLPLSITKIYRLWTLKDGILDKKSTEIVEKIQKYYNLSSEVVDKLKTEKNVKISSTVYVDKDNEFEWPNIKTSHESTGFCMALKTQIAILCDGTVVPCCLDCNGKIPLGNIHKTSFGEIINSKKCLDLKKSFEERKITEPLCLHCTFKNRFK